jgi:hypothetical protein
VKRLWKILIAKTKCNIHCIWQILRYNNWVCEFNAYDKSNRLIIVATTKDSLMDFAASWEKNNSFDIEKVFYYDSK